MRYWLKIVDGYYHPGMRNIGSGQLRKSEEEIVRRTSVKYARGTCQETSRKADARVQPAFARYKRVPLLFGHITGAALVLSSMSCFVNGYIFTVTLRTASHLVRESRRKHAATRTEEQSRSHEKHARQ